jgi:acetate kinase
MAETLLVINAGSSSIKFQLFAAARDSVTRELRGQISGIGSRPRLSVTDDANGSPVDRPLGNAMAGDAAAALGTLGDWLRARLDGQLPFAVGHRVVHGGPAFDGPVVVDDDVLEALERFVPLAPLHQPNNLAPIRAIRQSFPDILQVACFDTAFHRGHGLLADRFALPESLYDEGVRRYGFHGLSYEFIAAELAARHPQTANGRVVAAHLGSGASLCAMAAGNSVDSTMGFTALDGLPMGTRPGQLDPGVVLFLITQKGLPPQDVEHLLYHESGLKGLSGISNDVRDLAASDDPRAQLALDYFAFRVAKETGALVSVLGGIDGFVFTAGIGENAPQVRKSICARLAWLGVELDEEANAAGAELISANSKGPAVYVIPTDEEYMIARHTLGLARAAGSSTPRRQKVTL